MNYSKITKLTHTHTQTHIYVSVCYVAQSCPTLCDPVDSGLPGSSVCGILQAIILESVAIPSSRGSSQRRDWTQVSLIASGFYTHTHTHTHTYVCVCVYMFIYMWLICENKYTKYNWYLYIATVWWFYSAK